MTDSRGERRVVDLLSVPLEAYDVVTVLGLASYTPLMGCLTSGARREMALTVVRAVLKADTQVRRLLIWGLYTPNAKILDQSL